MSKTQWTLFVAGIVLLGGGCTYGVRGGVAGFAHTAKPMAIDADVAGGMGLGDDGAAAYTGFHATAEVAVGYDAAGDELHFMALTGLEGFHQPRGQEAPLGFRVGAAGGIEGSRSNGTGSVVLVATGAARYRLGDGGNTVSFVDLGGALGGGIGLDGEDGAPGESGFVGMLSVGIGVLHVDHWELPIR